MSRTHRISNHQPRIDIDLLDALAHKEMHAEVERDALHFNILSFEGLMASAGPRLETFTASLLGPEHEHQVAPVLESVRFNVCIGLLELPLERDAALQMIEDNVRLIVAVCGPVDVANDVVPAARPEVA